MIETCSCFFSAPVTSLVLIFVCLIKQENEKLYLQMKTQQAKSKANEEAMFNENQTLLNQLAFTR